MRKTLKELLIKFDRKYTIRDYKITPECNIGHASNRFIDNWVCLFSKEGETLDITDL